MSILHNKCAYSALSCREASQAKSACNTGTPPGRPARLQMTPASQPRSQQLNRSQRWQQPHRPCMQRAAVAEAERSDAAAAGADAGAFDDKFIGHAVALARASAPGEPCAALDELHRASAEALRSVRMPTRQNEDFRFTDVRPITDNQLQAPPGGLAADEISAAVRERALSEDGSSVQVVVRDGLVDLAASSLSGLPAGTYVGPISSAPADASLQQLGQLSRQPGGAFALLNGATAQDVLCITVPASIQLEQPIQIVYLSSGENHVIPGRLAYGAQVGIAKTAGSRDGGLSASSPRLLISLGTDAAAEVVEDFGPSLGSGTAAFTNTIAEVVLGEGASLRHGYLQLSGDQTRHMKGTFVYQAARSSYTLTEACLGGSLARHNINVDQVGEETSTTMRHFVLSGPKQVHDVHSKLRLEHPRGVAAQLHKCIVSASSGQGIFDGNVKVERLAQQTDAQQLSRNLLLTPKATVNVKPNLQIIADDVKCTHGCTVSDLEENQLFYFRSRGIDSDAARQMLVYSFGSEVTQHLKHKRLLERLQVGVKDGLALGFADIASRAKSAASA